MPSAVTGVRLFVSGSAPLLPETHEQFRSRTGHVILERYGMTETLMNTSNPYDGERVPGSVGPPLPDVEVRVSGDAPGADSDGSAGESAGVGVLEIRGPNVFAGYWRAPEKTKAEFADDGWFRSGDLGRIDSRGYVYIIGRAKDLVITGGYNVYPREVEAEIDALEGVQESAVIGVPHPDFGEGVTAIVVLRRGATLTERDVAMALQARLARYKIPKAVRFVSELPRNTMGKVQKNVLRQMFADCYRV
jgi:malonyl-CoA/methylmalonyl-CoA synthetase